MKNNLLLLFNTYTQKKGFFEKNGDEWWGHELKGHTPAASSAAIHKLLNVKKNLPIPSLFLKFFWFFVKRRMHITLALTLPFFIFSSLCVCVHYTQKNEQK